MRLIKLAAFALFGYALYEFVRGMTQDANLMQSLSAPGSQGGGQGSMGRGGSQQRSMGGGGGGATALNMSGPGGGEVVQTQDPAGGSSRRKVGRGVIG